MPYNALPAFLASLREIESTAARALEFCILTAARTGEVIRARWEKVDLWTAMWTIPGARMKGGKEHKVPLSARAIEILNGVRGLDRGWVFPGIDGKPMDPSAMLRTAGALGAEVTVHGFRSSFRDWAGDCTGGA